MGNEMESEKRWCENCMNNTKHEILDSNKVMVGKKTKFLYKCVDCGKKNACQRFEVWQNLHTSIDYFDKNKLLNQTLQNL